MSKIGKEFYINNRKKLVDSLKEKSVYIIHSGIEFQKTADENYPFTINRNFYYLTGINQSNVILMIIKGEKEYKEFLFIEENDPVLVKWVGAKLYKEEAMEISGIKNIKYLDDFDGFVFFTLNPSRKNYEEIENLYLDLERRQGLAYKTWALSYSENFKKEYPEIKVLNAYNKVVKLRSVKNEVEVEKIKESIEVTKGALENVLKNIKPGQYEYQTETFYDSYIKWHGQRDYAFKTICASGKNATVLHYTNNNSKIENNSLVLFDLGCQTDLYISDISRTYPANGKFTERQKEIYEIVLNCNKKCIEFLKPGVTWKEFNDYANSLLIDGLKKIGLIKEDKELVKYYWHSIGHSIGLDTHDPSIASMPFCEGMLTTVEPGLYLEDEGIGIRIEDNILITKDGCVNLSSEIIKEVSEIEEYMSKHNK